MQTQIKHVDFCWNWLDSFSRQVLHVCFVSSQFLKSPVGTGGLWQPWHTGAQASRAAGLALPCPAANAQSPGCQILSSSSPWSQAVLLSSGSSGRLFRDAQLRLCGFLFTFIYIFISVFVLYLLTGLNSIKTDTAVIETTCFLVHLFIV